MNSEERRGVELLQRYIRIDTTNPPGNEGPAAEFIESILAETGIESTIVKSPGGRPNLFARLKGKQGRAVCLMHHMDVVPCDKDRWSADPYGGEIRDGAVWGRGALDMKGQGLTQVLAFCDLAAAIESGDVELERDALLVAVSDEEDGGDEGARWLLDEHTDAVACEELLTEGGAGLLDALPGVDTFACSTTEKSYLWLRLKAEAQPGHGGIPPDDQAILNLIDLLTELRKAAKSMRMSPPVANLYTSLADAVPASLKFAIKAAAGPAGPAILPLIAKRLGPAQRALLRDSISITQLDAGYKANVVPGTAEATVDYRLLPDTDLDAHLESVRKTAGRFNVAVEVLGKGTAEGISPLGQLGEALERSCIESAPHARFVESVTPAFTDSRFWRAKGTSCLGLLPSLLPADVLATIHGDDERIPIDEYLRAWRITSETLKAVCG